MTADDITLDKVDNGRLRHLIGRRVRYEGGIYMVIEVLTDAPSLVLQDCRTHTTIQADQHGEAHRRVPSTLTLSVPPAEAGHIDLEAIGIELLDVAEGGREAHSGQGMP